MSYGVDVKSDGVVQVYRVSRGGIVTGEKVTVGEEAVEVRVLRSREFYEARAGCKLLWFVCLAWGWEMEEWLGWEWEEEQLGWSLD